MIRLPESSRRGHPPGRWAMLLALTVLTGCASVPAVDGRSQVQALTQGKTGVDAVPAATRNEDTDSAVARLLAQPLTPDAAVRVALLNNPQMQASLQALGVTDAERLQAGRLPNPHLILGRFTEGSKLEIERFIKLDVLGLLTLPWRTQWAGQQAELASLQAAQEVIRLAADTRKAWVRAVAAQQAAAYQRDARDAAEAGAELARRMARVGNWSRLQQAREQSLLADATAQLARAEHAALSAREQLTRLMGLWGTQTRYALPERLPPLPDTLQDPQDIEARALRERLDVRAAQLEARYVAQSLGFTRATGVINALDVGFGRNTTFNNATGERETKRGWELELPLPIFDWGQARNARAEATYLQSVTRVRSVAVQARSEAREAWHGWRTAHDLALHYRDEAVPLRKFINDEMLLRYNGMLASVWDLLGEVRMHMAAVRSSIDAQRDFWIADADLQLVLTGTSPGGLSALQAGSAAATVESKGH